MQRPPRIKADPDGPPMNIKREEVVSRITIPAQQSQLDLRTNHTAQFTRSFSEGWRQILKECNTIPEELQGMQRSGIYVDCTIICHDKKEIKCHKLVLARISPVLEQKLYSSDCIELRFTHKICNFFVDFAYIGVADNTTFDEAIVLYKLGKQVGCEALKKNCLSKYESLLTIENAFSSYCYLDADQDDDFVLLCLEFIKTNADRLLKKYPFVYISNDESVNLLSKSQVRRILSEENMNISSELCLLKALEVWAEHSVAEAGNPKSHETIRAEVESLLPKIRILMLSNQDLSEFLSNTRMFDQAEIAAIVYAHIHKDTTQLPRCVSKIRCPRDPIQRPIFRRASSLESNKGNVQAAHVVQQTLQSPTITADTTWLSPPTDLRQSSSSSRPSDHEPPLTKRPKLHSESSEPKSRPSEKMVIIQEDPKAFEQSKKASLQSQHSDPGSMLMVHRELADCALYVIDANNPHFTKIIPCHRAIIARFGGFLKSKVSGAKYGMYERASPDLPSLPLYEIISIPISIFEVILNFLYDGKLKWTNEKDILNIVSFARFLSITPLMKRCAEYLTQMKPSPSKIWAALMLSQELNDKYLEKQCFEVIKEKPQECFDGPLEDIKKCPVELIEKISALKTINVESEVDIIVFLEKWAMANIDPASNQAIVQQLVQELLARSIRNVRFLSLDLERFKEISKTHLLSENDQKAVFAVLSGSFGGKHKCTLSQKINTCKTPRFKTYHYGNKKFTSFIMRKEDKMARLVVDKTGSRSASISIEAEKTFVLHGFTLHAQYSSASSSYYNEDIIVTVWSLDYAQKEYAMKRYYLLKYDPEVKYGGDIKIVLARPMIVQPRENRCWVIKVQLNVKGAYEFPCLKSVGTKSVQMIPFMDNLYKVRDVDDCWGNSGIFKSIELSKEAKPL
ncbi:uncharacterized protein LOC132205133 [Neocloeon triangulifer]|uniref:uncharacterized protein LOC132205133 n=1 Tax=Neocloeon triangulifer TaxID=2078957 RepID=UPI00286F64A3|nr:uncharacterized protein LOC132205133 [Neocloeon triangulifer]XP_059489998.1 uncharacterized protein LOC132205133 [Neocloeon triangulifer]